MASRELIVEVNAALDGLIAWAEEHDFAGADPYDLLASSLPLTGLGHGPCFVLTQLHKRTPLDLRWLLRVPPQRLPKGIALFLKAYALRYQREPRPDDLATMRRLADWLLEHRASGFAGSSWGLPFAYASRSEFLPAGYPSVVVTSFVHDALHEYGVASGDERIPAVLSECCEFLLESVPRERTDAGLCFAYTPKRMDYCFNANALAAQMLARSYVAGGGSELAELARAAIDFTVHHIESDGHWNYSIRADGSQKHQIDFHQGFILLSLLEYMERTGDDRPELIEALDAGARYYRNRQFDGDGRSLWRVPKRLPTDIHNQSVGILTFARLASRDSTHAEGAARIADWTLQNMHATDGAFYYRRGRLLVNRQRYVRWGQAWMMWALVELQRVLS